MARYSLTKPARADLRDIVSYIRKDSRIAAARVRAKFQAEMRKVAAFPGLGHTRPEVADETIRFWLVYSSYLIVYRLHTRPLQILRILHGARDLNRIFGGS